MIALIQEDIFLVMIVKETVSQFSKAVIPDEHPSGGRDPWFDRLTTLSEVEGESNEKSI